MADSSFPVFASNTLISLPDVGARRPFAASRLGGDPYRPRKRGSAPRVATPIRVHLRLVFLRLLCLFAAIPSECLSLLHAIKRLLQNLEVARVIELGPGGLDPLLFQCVFGRSIDLVENPEKAGERHIS
jgi:hypothetical protein